jgi:hypothetical protein
MHFETPHNSSATNMPPAMMRSATGSDWKADMPTNEPTDFVIDETDITHFRFEKIDKQIQIYGLSQNSLTLCLSVTNPCGLI